MDNVNWELLVKYLSDECRDDEKNIVREWINARLENKNEFDRLKKIWDSSEKKEDSTNAVSAYKKVLEGIELTENSVKNKRFKTVKKITMAAAALLIVSSAVFLYEMDYFRSKPANEIVWNEKITLPGEKALITLADGSRITLNSASKLKYSPKNQKNKREVYLEGEAFFDVVHDSANPFIVYSSNLITVDLGTKFNINSFPEESNVLISLVEGKVEIFKRDLKTENSVVELQPEQQLVYIPGKETAKVRNFDILQETGWKDNILKFESEPLEKVFVKLERAFGIEFELKDNSFSKFKITGNFKNEKYSTICEALKRLTKLNYKSIKEGNTIKKVIFYKQSAKGG